MKNLLEQLLNNFQTPEGLLALLLTLVVLAPYVLFFFRKGIIKQLVEDGGIATKKDLTDALRQLKENDLKHIQYELQSLRKDSEASDAALRHDLQALRTDAEASDAALRHELDLKLEALRHELDLKLEALRHELDYKLDALRQALDLKLELILKTIGYGVRGTGYGEEKEIEKQEYE